MNYKILQKELKTKSSLKRAQSTMRFFKTGKGQYGEGDHFIGVSVPEIRTLVKKYPDVSLPEIKFLLLSPIHEERALGLFLLVEQFKKADEGKKKKIFHFYLKNKKAVNNWDLVDCSAPTIIGGYCLETSSTEVMDKLLLSQKHWDRRIAILATLAFIRQGQTKLTFKYAQSLLTDQEDLMHKATGWMLREAGKKDSEGLRKFIKNHVSEMPRTMLRYSIELFDNMERAEILKHKKMSKKGSEDA